MPAVLHVTNGDSTVETLRRTTLGGTVLAWRDALHAGPVPAVPRPELLRGRAAFLSECGWGGSQEILSSLEERDGRLERAFADGEPVVLWFEHDLYDQLQLLDILALAHDAEAAPDAIVIGTFPGKPSFRGLGELTAEELETLWPVRRAVPAQTRATAAAIWADVRQPTPEALARRVGRDAPPDLPFVRPALLRLLEELPAAADGLSTTERTALRAISEGAWRPAAAFEAAQDLEPAPFLGDTWFFAAVAELGGGSQRLVGTEDGNELPALAPGDEQRFAQLSVRLTEAGERVLAGGADRVELLGVDRWVGGTHVSTDALWRWDPSARRLVRP